MVAGDPGQRPSYVSNVPGRGEKDCRRTEETYAELQAGKSARNEQRFLYSSPAYWQSACTLVCVAFTARFVSSSRL